MPVNSIPDIHPQGDEIYRISKREAELISPVNSTNSLASSLAVKLDPSHLTTSPVGGISYEGIQQVDDPPDAHIAVGPSNIVVVVNRRWECYDKSNPGNRRDWSTFADFLMNVAPPNTDLFDARVIYDRWSSRFIMIIDGRNNVTQQSFWFLIVSQGSSWISGWSIWTVNPAINGSTPTTNLADRPDIGVDGNNIYITSNMYDFATSATGYAKIRAYRLADLYVGALSGYFDAWDLRNPDNSPAWDIRPADRFGSKGDMFLANAASSSKLSLWRDSDPFDMLPITPTNISVGPFSQPPNAQQPGVTNTLRTNDYRILQAQYRAGGIWATHHINYDWGTGPRSAIRLYKIREDALGLLQQITVGSPDYFYFYPSFATDQDDNVVTSFSISSRSNLIPGLYASLGFTGRQSQDPPNTIDPITTVIKAGEGVYTSTMDSAVRWGDYSGTALDPAD